MGGVKKKSKPLFIKREAIRVTFDGNAKVTLTLARPHKGAVEVTVHGGIAASNGATSGGDVSMLVQ
jgi:hypothetical protein